MGTEAQGENSQNIRGTCKLHTESFQTQVLLSVRQELLSHTALRSSDSWSGSLNWMKPAKTWSHGLKLCTEPIDCKLRLHCHVVHKIEIHVCVYREEAGFVLSDSLWSCSSSALRYSMTTWVVPGLLHPAHHYQITDSHKVQTSWPPDHHSHISTKWDNQENY